MAKQLLKDTQLVVFNMIERMLRGDRLNHAFLLVGVEGTPKKEAAYFIGQSLVCKEDDLACEKCNTCIRVKNNNYGDFIYLDSDVKRVVIENIDELHERFSRTAFEAAGRKFYIINSIDKCDPRVLNKLLKFLEEPNDTVAILTCSNVDKVLPTIVSRCQIINFKNPDVDSYIDLGIKEGLPIEDAYVIANIKPNMLMKETFEEDEYKIAIEASKEFIDNFNDLNRVLFYLHQEVLRDASKNVKILVYLFEILALFFKDVQREIDEDYGLYSEYVKKIEVKDYSNIILSLIEARDKCGTNNFNVSLILDQLFYQIIMEGNK
ncbi:MAG TPA: hypothetical protein DHS57_01960 [Erysipelotrichaceae bacterium]|nr:hypothetical protein [Erysipelotrichaceae bacterium]